MVILIRNVQINPQVLRYTLRQNFLPPFTMMPIKETKLYEFKLHRSN
jgi:hypothetical protein